MRSLSLALFAEGPTDHRFLSPVLRRVTGDLCRRRASEIVEIGPVIELHSPKDCADADRATQICEAAREAEGAFHVLFVHTNGAGNADAAHRERVEPAVRRISQDRVLGWIRTLGVVPVREMEAWALADGNALRLAFGTVLDDHRLGLPALPRLVEGVSDPKQALAQAYAAATGARRRKAKDWPDFLEAIAVNVQLAKLREVPAFQRSELSLQMVLTELGYLPRPNLPG